MSATFQAGPLTVIGSGGEDGAGGGEGPAIVLCHGFGAPGDDLVALGDIVEQQLGGLPPGTRWFFPAAPLSLDMGFGMPARAWWPIDLAHIEDMMMRGDLEALLDETPRGLLEAADSLLACLDSLETTHGVRAEKAILGGFSQGAMISAEIAIMRRRFAGVCLFSGTLLSRGRWLGALPDAGKDLVVAQSHGTMDPLLPFVAAEVLRDLLREHGATVDFVAHSGGHEIPAGALSALVRLAKAVF